MRIYTETVWQMTDDGLEVLEEESYEYTGPVARCDGGGDGGGDGGDDGLGAFGGPGGAVGPGVGGFGGPGGVDGDLGEFGGPGDDPGTVGGNVGDSPQAFGTTGENDAQDSGVSTGAFGPSESFGETGFLGFGESPFGPMGTDADSAESGNLGPSGLGDAIAETVFSKFIGFAFSSLLGPVGIAANALGVPGMIGKGLVGVGPGLQGESPAGDPGGAPGTGGGQDQGLLAGGPGALSLGGPPGAEAPASLTRASNSGYAGNPLRTSRHPFVQDTSGDNTGAGGYLS
ncbi:MAG: hypothetical protein ACYS5V_14515 [Planctomycetota bacterium]|jgi:hypothetical protein